MNITGYTVHHTTGYTVHDITGYTVHHTTGYTVHDITGYTNGAIAVHLCHLVCAVVDHISLTVLREF